jgi:hypothetical protein
MGRSRRPPHGVAVLCLDLLLPIAKPGCQKTTGMSFAAGVDRNHA